MSKTIINIQNDADLDMALIPNEIYDMTINKEKTNIIKYFLEHPELLMSFVGFNGKLKLANQLASNLLCGCYYTMPWITHYQVENSLNETVLSFNQQVLEYRYMIIHSPPSPDISYMQYLSSIALTMISQIGQMMYYMQNNLEFGYTNYTKYLATMFPNRRSLYMYLLNNFGGLFNKKSVL